MKRLLMLSLLAVLLSTRVAGSADLHNVLTDFTITSWNEKDGLPPATIVALAQDQDGYIWVGTREGLLRFDGVRFTTWDAFSQATLPRSGVRSLLAARDGAMWVGFAADGLVARIVGGAVTVFDGERGLRRGAVVALSEDGDGVVWAGGDNGLWAFDHTRWTQWAQDRGIPSGAVTSVFADRDGTVHAASSGVVVARRVKAHSFEQTVRAADTMGGFAQTSDGAVWFTDPTVGYRSTSARSVEPSSAARQGRGLRMVVDRKGSLWVGTGGQGLWRTRNPGGVAAPERATSLSGLLGDGVYALIEDRDGNIWAGTTEGLNRLTPRTIEQIIDIGLVRGVASAPDGTIWIRTVDKLFTVDASLPGERREIVIPADAHGIAVDDRGAWLAAGAGLARIDRGGRVSRVSSPDVREAGAVESLVLDRRGGVWLITAAAGIMHQSEAGLRRLVLGEPLRAARVTAALVDREDRAWFAFDNGRVAVTQGDDVRVVASPESGAPIYTVLHEDQDGHIWLAGNGVVSRYEDGRFLTAHASARLPIHSLMSIVTDDRGALWIGSGAGVLQMNRDDFDALAADPGVAPRFRTFTRSDGVAGTPVAVGLNLGSLRARDGRLWFVTTRGVTVLDPHVLEAHTTPASVRFEGALADDRRVRPGEDTRLPAGTRKVQIDYTLVDLTSPLKARFRYRLDPFDHDWVDAGNRRQAFYTNLRPGNYVFRAIATDAAGGGRSQEAVWAFSVAPRFFQTATFAAISIASFCLLLIAGWRLRERHLRKQFSLVISERARLGREIHDTLLQGLVAIALQFDSLAHDLAPTPRLQARFLRLRDRIEEYIREARRSIWDLHTQPAHGHLIESVRRAGEFATDGRDIAFSLQVQGTPYTCPPRVEEQVVRIAQEAALNSVRHASPRTLSIELVYDESAVTLRIADDGCGFEAGGARAASHFGITSMHDRVRSVGGSLTLDSVPGRGTDVIAVLPVASGRRGPTQAVEGRTGGNRRTDTPAA